MTSASLKDQSAVYPFAFCAARYLRAWETSEKALHNSIAKRPTPSEVASALSYFRVSRNFPGLSKSPRTANLVFRALQDVRGDRTLATPIAKVEALADRFDKHFNYNLSAASKLLWLSSRSRYVLYDSRAVKALSDFTDSKRLGGNYAAFHEAWCEQYSNFLPQIQKAIDRLPTGRAFMPRTEFTDVALRELSSESWFTERVFDIFLWEVGRPQSVE